uniref:PIN domain-containing protein n=1 Tax=Pseudo-nitzschia australis TaxID=44445 RepID=A0A7S4AL11_9STRA|mmetsp:Transcript_20028/g.43559  ORF Transcript_20028/g.43559 Transcript_20028/m.43559 type:complete len:790 (+) Transcript_20028:199-2568(+)
MAEQQDSTTTAAPPATAENEQKTKNTPPSTSRNPNPNSTPHYYAMVVDSGPIIKQDVRNLMGKAGMYVTTPSVIREIRDSRARDHLENYVVPLLDLQIREPSDKGVQEAIAFSKQTGDYASLSTVDLQVLGLTIDLEREGNRIMGGTSTSEHIRTTPKRKIGLGSIVAMNQGSKKDPDAAVPNAVATVQEEKEDANTEILPEEETQKLLGREDYDEVEDSEEDDESDDNDDDDDDGGGDDNSVDVEQQESIAVGAPTPVPESAEVGATATPPVKKSWATLVNPTAASVTATTLTKSPAFSLSLAPMKLTSSEKDSDGNGNGNGNGGGQFDDASEDESENATNTLEEELQMEFPSLSATITVPYEGEDDEIRAKNDETLAAAADSSETGKEEEKDGGDKPHKKKASVFMTEEEKQKNLQPLSKSGLKYNSFRKYKGLMKPKPPVKKVVERVEDEESSSPTGTSSLLPTSSTTDETSTQQQSSRFLSGGGGEIMQEEDDDGVGWITSADDIKSMKTEGGGRLDPGKTGGPGPNDSGNKPAAANTNKNAGPPVSHRTACATTDFAMQNVLLQMNLVLLSTDGMRIRRLKSWVIRCGACFKIHGAEEDFKDGTNHHMKRLFCSHCGSGDLMQRISASVDGKTGRLKLHFSKRKTGRHHSIRGTKFSLPKPGSGNKYKGDLLLREDQLLSGAWNQKVKINSGMKYQQSRSQSMFGRDIASSVGCNVGSTSSATFGGKGWSNPGSSSSLNGGFNTNSDDIRVAFGARKNPNAAKGRERRGKKKKSSDRACGMRRY